jgi:hypothetical protein
MSIVTSNTPPSVSKGTLAEPTVCGNDTLQFWLMSTLLDDWVNEQDVPFCVQPAGQ